MRIEVVCPYWRPVTGGIEDHVASLARAAKAAGHAVRIHTLDRDTTGRPLPAKETVEGVEVRRWPARRRIGYYTTRFEPLLEGDVAHLHAYGLWTHDWVALRYPEVPMLLTLHHGLRVPAPTPLHALYHAWHRRRAGARTLGRMDRIVAVTPLDAERLARRGILAERVVVIPNGVPEAAFTPTEPAPPPEGWDAFLVYVGRIHREKRVGDAVRALGHLPPRVGLVVAGPDHGGRRAVERLARRLGVAGRVRFVGLVEEEAKRGLLAGAAALVLPSQYEAQGRVILEAWAQGTPVVASAVGGVPRLVDEGVDGSLHAVGDVRALAAHAARLVENAVLARAMGSAGRDKALREYREEALVARTLALYEEVVAARAVTETVRAGGGGG